MLRTNLKWQSLNSQGLPPQHAASSKATPPKPSPTSTINSGQIFKCQRRWDFNFKKKTNFIQYILISSPPQLLSDLRHLLIPQLHDVPFSSSLENKQANKNQNDYSKKKHTNTHTKSLTTQNQKP